MCFYLFSFIFAFLNLFFQPIEALEQRKPSQNKIRMLYNSLDPRSISQHLAFYEIYGSTSIGQQALKDAWNLMNPANNQSKTLDLNALSPSTLNSLISLINKPIDTSPPPLSQQNLNFIEKISLNLCHTKLKGHFSISEEEIYSLPPDQVDLARGIFLSQYGSDLLKVRSYEAIIDLMALQILARLPPNATPEEKIRRISQFIFEDMGFRFPPHSLYAKNIDLYTFLPSVLDSRRGVCLGVSILYICIAQRLGLSLEMITPPGHIYVRYKTPEKEINIETTARGIHLDSEEYLNIQTRSLQQRSIKEVIGLAHFNQAGVFMQREEYEQALKSYQKAEFYLPNDYLLKELLGLTYLFTGNQAKGIQLLAEIRDQIPDYSITNDTLPIDFLDGKINIDSLKIIHKFVDEDRTSILAKKKLLEDVVIRYPQFRAGFFHLAITWLQLHRSREALEVLKQCHLLDLEDPEINYYLSILHMERLNYNLAWKHLLLCEKAVQAKSHNPKALKDLRKSLSTVCPEYITNSSY